MRNIKLIIQYDGSRYKGFQRLKDNDMTIQGKVEAVLSKMTDENIEIIASGRTDMGVHAYGQVVNFKTESTMSLKKIGTYLNEFLPEDIVVKNIEEVDERFHSRYNVKSKVYLYKIDNSYSHTPFTRKYSTHISKKLNIDLMKEASKHFIGEHDFTSFASSKSKKKSHIREIKSISIQEANESIEVYIEGDGFLYNMIRIIIGTLIDVGHKKIEPDYINTLIENKNRELSPETAPAKGLYLYKVKY